MKNDAIIFEGAKICYYTRIPSPKLRVIWIEVSLIQVFEHDNANFLIDIPSIIKPIKNIIIQAIII